MIDANRLCPNCMQHWEDKSRPCPNCGFFGEKRQEGLGQLPAFTILAGRYLLGNRIGSGGFGITYLAMDLQEEIPVAIKEFFPPDLAKREGEQVTPLSGEEGRYFREGLRSFRREAALLSRFAGTGAIAGYRDYVTENGTAYLVMEYVRGMTLTQYMRRMGETFSEERAKELMYPVMLAVKGMHETGVLHRDISPENLILKPDGTLTLIDFGAAREFSLEEEENLTVILKRGYAPDEQYHSGSRQGPWTDLYACCAVLYQMVSGILPQDAAERRKKDMLMPLDEVEGISVTASFARIIEKGMTIYAAERYPSIKSLLRDLFPNKEAACGQPDREALPGGTQTAGEETEGNGGKSRLKWLFAPAACLLLGLGLYFGLTAQVPKVADLPKEEAVRILKEAGFEVSVEDVYSQETEKGRIVGQSESGRRKKGILIHLENSLGKAVEVAEVTGMYLSEARNALEGDLETEILMAEDDQAEYGTVIAQSPAAGETVSQGETVTLTVCVRDVAGMELEAAGELVARLELQPEVEHAFSADVREGCVVKAELEPENGIARLTVSDGPERALVPDLRGMSQEEAQAAAEEAGLVPVLSGDRVFYSPYEAGIVAYQRIEPGTEVDVGTRLYYETSAGIPTPSEITLEASATEVTLKAGGDPVTVTLNTASTGGVVSVASSGIKTQVGTWYIGQPFPLYITAPEGAQSGMVQVYVYTGKMNQGTDVVVDYVNIYCTVE